MSSSSWSAPGWKKGSWPHEANPGGRQRVRSTISALPRRDVLRPRLPRHLDSPVRRDLQFVRNPEGAARRARFGFHPCIPWLRSSVEQHDIDHVPGVPDERKFQGLNAADLIKRPPEDSNWFPANVNQARDGNRKAQVD